MNTKMAHFVWWLDGWRTNVHDKDSEGYPRIVADGIKEQVEAKMQEGKHDCTHFYWHFVKEIIYKNEWSFINICKLPIILHFCFYNLALNLSATTEGRPKDSLWFITDNRPFTIKHEALFLNWLLFVHHITENLNYIPNFPENGDSSEFFHIQRGKVLWEVGGSIRSLLSEWPSYSYNNSFKWFPNRKIQLISCIARLIIVFQLITFLVQDMWAGGSNYSLAHGQQICKSSFGDNVSRQTTTL